MFVVLASEYLQPNCFNTLAESHITSETYLIQPLVLHAVIGNLIIIMFNSKNIGYIREVSSYGSFCIMPLD